MDLRRQIHQRSNEIFSLLSKNIAKRTDSLFIVLFILQWIASIIIALYISPKTWSGLNSTLHPHVLAAALLGGIISLFPVCLAIFYSGHKFTAHVIACGQLLWSSIFIHLTGGRIETHFHIFGSLAFLAFYRDWKVLILPSVIVAFDHYFRGVYWPQSVFGIAQPEQWRWLEHAGWVIFEDCFLVLACLTGVNEMRAISDRTARLEFTNQMIEARVNERTHELEVSQEQLKRAGKSRDTFLANISHEIRTPLNRIIGMSTLLEQTPLTRDCVQISLFDRF